VWPVLPQRCLRIPALLLGLEGFVEWKIPHMKIRRYDPGEEPEVWKVFFEATHESNARSRSDEFFPDGHFCFDAVQVGL
jgi:hypothetical protein